MPVDTSRPVAYFDGEIILVGQDLVVPSGGFFGHTRRYTNQMTGDYFGPNGFNWFVQHLPEVMDSIGSVVVVFDPNYPYWFDESGGNLVPRYGVRDVSLQEDTVAKTFTFTRTEDGQANVTIFKSFSAATNPGGFVSHTDARGVVTTVAAQTGSRIDELQRTYTVSGTTTYESILYTYYSSGSATGLLQYVTYRRKVGAGSWSQLKRVNYQYHLDTAGQGSLNDLKAAKEQQPDGLGGWNDVAIHYYRYYRGATGELGFAHAIKMHFGPEAYRRMFNAGINVDTASDPTIKPYADHYYEYASGRSVSKEISAVCNTCIGGGSTSDTFTYTNNPRNPASGYNVWAVKTEQTLPDSAKIIVYTNYVGYPMLRVYLDSSGTKKWCNFYRYGTGAGDNSQLIWEAMPSAVSGYDDSYDDLLHFSSGSYQYLRNSDGLIRVTQYYAATDIPNGAVEGYIASKKLRHGQAGTDILLSEYTYTSHTAGSVTIYLPKKIILYPDDTSTTTKITTEYTYDEWYTSSNRLKKLTTTLPAIPAKQNGAGTSATTVEEFDEFGNMTKLTDERGVINLFNYDVVLGKVTKQTLNYASSPAANTNLVTDLSYDEQGRLTQTLGPSHTVDLSGTATSIRTATWTVYSQSARPVSGTWALDEIRRGIGYATGSAPSYTYTLVNPARISGTDKNGRIINQITSKRTSGSGKLSSSDTFVQTDWKSWNSVQYDDRGRIISEREYQDIPSSGEGVVTTSYGQTDYGYDALERRNRTSAPGGTIMRMVWTAPQRVASVWFGTNDTGATDSNPAGTGSPNNMVKIAENQYDSGSDMADGNLTQLTQYASSTDTRIDTYGYDWRNRRTSTDGEIDLYVAYTYDNLDRLTRIDAKDTNAAGNLIARRDTRHNDLGRVYQELVYAVDPSSGSVGNALTTNMWYDASGKLIKQIEAGAGLVFRKLEYNSAGWLKATYVGYNTTNDYATAISLSGDTIVSQVEYTWDDASNLLKQIGYLRLNDATGTGALSAAAQPKARLSYRSFWCDGIDRRISSAVYGAISSFTRPDVTPSRSDTVLVVTTAFDDAGRAYSAVDEKGIETLSDFDDAGRVVKVREAYGTGDERETQLTYTLDTRIATVKAINSITGDQTTIYTYGTTLSDSQVARNDILGYVTFPESVSDRKYYTYNRLGEDSTVTDQRGTVRTFSYDKLGRLIHDRVTTLGQDTDDSVLRISRTYDVRGLLQKITSYDNATVGSGNVLDEITYDFSVFSRVRREWQEHGGSVDGSSLSVEYVNANADSNSNHIRQKYFVYPSGQRTEYFYGSPDGLEDRLNRISSIRDGSTQAVYAAYTYLGGGFPVRVDYPEVSVMLDLWGGTSGTFDGLDRFGRISDQRWKYYGSPAADLDRYQYGYDRNSNCQWKRNTIGSNLDEYYIYDNLNRMVSIKRGTLTGTPPTGISGTPAKQQDWSLDSTSNWYGYITKTAGTTDLNQSRTHNTSNEVSAITETAGPAWVDPTYDAAGNTTTFPQGTDPTHSFTATYDAWNRLRKVQDGSDKVAVYRYDGQHRRIVKERYVSNVLDERRHYYFNKNFQSIEERLDNDVVVAVNLWGIQSADELIYGDRPNLHSYALYDSNFNVTCITDTGNALERYTYTPYGVRTCHDANWTPYSPSGYAWVIGYQGLLHDIYKDANSQEMDSGIVYNRARLLHPALGRFLQRDVLEYIDGYNLYESRRSSPGRSDSTGLYDRGGHFYTIYAVAIAAGVLPGDAMDFAYFGQYPDQIKDLDPVGAGIDMQTGSGNQWEADVSTVIHQLNAASDQGVIEKQKSIIKKNRRCLQELLKEWIALKNPALNWEIGILIHAIGDSYAHTYVDVRGTLRAYPPDKGHIDSGHGGHRADEIGYDPDKYAEYVTALFQSLGGDVNKPAQAKQLNRIIANAATLPSVSEKSVDVEAGLMDTFVKANFAFPAGAWTPKNPPPPRSKLGTDIDPKQLRPSAKQLQALVDKIKARCPCPTEIDPKTGRQGKGGQ